MGYPGSLVLTGTASVSAISDTYATHWDILGKGGIHSVATVTDRDAIPSARRSWGMFCVVYADGTALNNKTYQLRNVILGGTNGTITDNANWVEFTSGASGGHVIEAAGTPLTQRSNLDILNGLTASDSGSQTELRWGGAQTANTTISGAFDTIFNTNGLSVGNTTRQTSSILELTSTTKALLLPRIATEGNITTPIDGHIYYNSTNLDYRVRVNSQWMNLTRPVIVIDNASTSIILTEADRNKIYFLGAATDITVSGGNISVGFMVTLYKTGVGDVIFSPIGGTTLDAVDDTIITDDGGATFIQKSASVWQGAGALGTGAGGTVDDTLFIKTAGTSILTDDVTISGNAYIWAAQVLEYTVLAGTSYSVTSVSSEFTGTSGLELNSDNLIANTVGSVSLDIEPDNILLDGGAVAGNRDLYAYFRRFTGGNNNHTNTGSASFIWGDNNINAGTFGSAMFGELGEIETSVGAAFITGERNYVSAYGGVAQGRGVKVSGTYSWGGGWYSVSGQSGKTNTKAPLIDGDGSFGFFETTAAQTVGHGVLANSSAVLGGLNPNIPADSPYSVILGGNGIKARAADGSQVYVPNFNINTTPLNDNALVQVLVRDATTGQIKYRTASSIAGGTGITNAAAANELMKSDGTNAVASGIFSTTAGNLTLGTGLAGSTRTITATGSATDVSLYLTNKGAGTILVQESTLSGFLQIGGGAKAQIGSSANNYLDFTGSAVTLNTDAATVALGAATNIATSQVLTVNGTSANIALSLLAKGSGDITMTALTGDIRMLAGGVFEFIGDDIELNAVGGSSVDIITTGSLTDIGVNLTSKLLLRI